MTEEDKEFLKFLKKYMKRHGYAPTVHEMHKLTRLSTSRVNTILRKLCRYGMLEYMGKASAIVIPGLEYREEVQDADSN